MIQSSRASVSSEFCVVQWQATWSTSSPSRQLLTIPRIWRSVLSNVNINYCTWKPLYYLVDEMIFKKTSRQHLIFCKMKLFMMYVFCTFDFFWVILGFFVDKVMGNSNGDYPWNGDSFWPVNGPSAHRHGYGLTHVGERGGNPYHRIIRTTGRLGI